MGRQKTYEWTSKSLQQIEKKFLQASLLCVAAPDSQMGQIGSENTGKSIRSDLRSWIAPDGNLPIGRTV